VQIIDPLDLNLQSIFKPHFAYAEGWAPKALNTLAHAITRADGYDLFLTNKGGAVRPLFSRQYAQHFFGAVFEA